MAVSLYSRPTYQINAILQYTTDYCCTYQVRIPGTDFPQSLRPHLSNAFYFVLLAGESFPFSVHFFSEPYFLKFSLFCWPLVVLCTTGRYAYEHVVVKHLPRSQHSTAQNSTQAIIVTPTQPNNGQLVGRNNPHDGFHPGVLYSLREQGSDTLVARWLSCSGCVLLTIWIITVTFFSSSYQTARLMHCSAPL